MLALCGLSDPRFKAFWASRNGPHGLFADARQRLMCLSAKKNPGSFLPGFRLEKCQTIGIRSCAERER
jgi:hypothetical protein